MTTCKTCENLILLEEFNGQFKNYDEYLYNEIFLKQIINNNIYFNNKLVKLKKFPKECNREQAYFHLTTIATDKNIPWSEREPDFRRCERLHWMRPSIETNHIELCGLPCFVYYTEIYKGNRTRIHLFNEKERYLIVLEDRNDYILLITAFYIHEDYYLKKTIQTTQKKSKYNFI